MSVCLLCSGKKSHAARGKLQMLGLALGIREWSETFLEHLRYPPECLHKVHEQVKLRTRHYSYLYCTK